MAKVSREVIERERRLLSSALREALQRPAPRKRTTELRKVSDYVKRSWISAGCFGEAVQWRLGRKRRKKRP